VSRGYSGLAIPPELSGPLKCSEGLSRGQGEAALGWLLGRRFVGPDQVDELACLSVRDGAGQTDIRGLVTAGRAVRQERLCWSRRTSVASTWLTGGPSAAAQGGDSCYLAKRVVEKLYCEAR
jgi:hypothetical protein